MCWTVHVSCRPGIKQTSSSFSPTNAHASVVICPGQCSFMQWSTNWGKMHTWLCRQWSKTKKNNTIEASCHNTLSSISSFLHPSGIEEQGDPLRIESIDKMWFARTSTVYLSVHGSLDKQTQLWQLAHTVRAVHRTRITELTNTWGRTQTAIQM